MIDAYGTPPVSGFTRMPFASSSLGAEQPLLNSELLGYGRDPLAPIKDAVTADGDVVVPLDAEAFGFWLKAAFGTPTTTGAEAPYTHEFQSGSWTLPSMSIETGMPEVQLAALARAHATTWPASDLFFFRKLKLYALSKTAAFAGDEVASEVLLIDQEAFWDIEADN